MSSFGFKIPGLPIPIPGLPGGGGGSFPTLPGIPSGGGSGLDPFSGLAKLPEAVFKGAEGIFKIGESIFSGVETFGEAFIILIKVAIKLVKALFIILDKGLSMLDLIVWIAPFIGGLWALHMIIESVSMIDLGETLNDYIPLVNLLVLTAFTTVEYFIYSVDNGMGWNQFKPDIDINKQVVNNISELPTTSQINSIKQNEKPTIFPIDRHLEPPSSREPIDGGDGTIFYR